MIEDAASARASCFEATQAIAVLPELGGRTLSATSATEAGDRWPGRLAHAAGADLRDHAIRAELGACGDAHVASSAAASNLQERRAPSAERRAPSAERRAPNAERRAPKK